MSCWRMHIRPKGGDPKRTPQARYDFCLDKNIIGMGWPVTSSYSGTPLSFSEYMTKGRDEYGADDISWNTAIERLREMEQHDLVWIRSPRPYNYHLCRVVGSWDYRDSKDYLACDLVNVRAVEIVTVDASAIPADLVARFSGGSVIEPIRDQGQVEFTIATWHKCHEVV